MEFERISPEKAGLPSKKILDFLEDMKASGIELHSFMFLRSGKVFAEGYFSPYRKDVPHIMFSFTKSLTSTAIGFAWQEGLLKLEDKLTDIFPDKLPEKVSENLAKCTVGDLLTMGCGHKDEIPSLGLDTDDWVKAFLANPFVYEPGTKFMYNTAGTNMLVEVLKRKTGKNLLEFLEPRLFVPLGMKGVICYKMPDGTDVGGAGSLLVTDNMARFIQFVANFGVWEGKRLLKAEWFELATKKQISNANSPDQNNHWSAGYGFQFWRCDLKNTFRADGAFGQYGIVCEDEDAVFVLQSASTSMHIVIDLVAKHLKNEFKDKPLPENPVDKGILDYVCENLQLAAPLSQKNYGSCQKYSGKKYAPAIPLDGTWAEIIGGTGVAGRYSSIGIAPVNNHEKIQALEFDFNGDDARITADYGSRSEVLPVSMNSRYNSFKLGDKYFGAVGTWLEPDLFTLYTRNASAATGTVFSVRFTDTGLTLSACPTLPEFGGLGDNKQDDIIMSEVKK